ncbi:hypothetical protein GCM10010178_90370 [Lentzea flava]|uniref:Uncharacterized protein n=1 Tax=Lentzea flava TaxID=103732 RepID=A0ABQ2VH11_9PSEU|nr:hypothetical protein GCM10010178_90370 [Lentzea flava]
MLEANWASHSARKALRRRGAHAETVTARSSHLGVRSAERLGLMVPAEGSPVRFGRLARVVACAVYRAGSFHRRFATIAIGA